MTSSSISLSFTYNTSMTCTYKNKDIIFPEEKEKLNENEEEWIRLVIFQSELVRAFGMEQFDENIIPEKIQELYEIYGENPTIQTMIHECIANASISLTEADAFLLLFSFQTFDIVHQCLCKIIKY